MNLRSIKIVFFLTLLPLLGIFIFYGISSLRNTSPALKKKEKLPVYPSNNYVYAKKNKLLPGSKKKRILLFGDSRIKQWRYTAHAPGYLIINRGISGEVTPQMRMRFNQDVIKLRPSIVIIQAGINDIISTSVFKDSTDAIVRRCNENLEYFVKKLLERNVRVVFISIIPPAPADKITNQLMRNNSIAKHVDQINRKWLGKPVRKNLYILDSSKIFIDSKGNWLPGVSRDALHIADYGYDKLNKAVNRLLLK